MNDRFKLKCFNKKQNKMYEVRSISYYQGNVKRIEVDDNGKILIFDEYENNIGVTVLIQCTGLKDKNAKLIYEGDIVRVGNSVFEIVNELGCFMLATKTNIEAIHLFPNSWNDNVYPLSQLYFEYDNEENYIDQLEVIGNIYENKELLDEN